MNCIHRFNEDFKEMKPYELCIMTRLAEHHGELVMTNDLIIVAAPYEKLIEAHAVFPETLQLDVHEAQGSLVVLYAAGDMGVLKLYWEESKWDKLIFFRAFRGDTRMHVMKKKGEHHG